MAFVRKSKFRHVFGQANRKDKCYDSIRITKASTVESNFCAVNPKFVAVVTESGGGGSFLVLPIERCPPSNLTPIRIEGTVGDKVSGFICDSYVQSPSSSPSRHPTRWNNYINKYGRIDMNEPLVCGHREAVCDIAWSPFNDNLIASSSEDSTIKIWNIPDEGLKEHLTEPLLSLENHKKKVIQILWHPIAENILLSVGFDHKIIIWNLFSGEVITEIDCFGDMIYCASWNYDGSLIGTTCKDKKIRIINPLTGEVVKEGNGHEGGKPQRIQLLKDDLVFTTGFSRRSDRELSLYKMSDLSKPVQTLEMDRANSVLMIFYDPDTSMIYVSGKGDSKINYYEITNSGTPEIHWLSIYQSPDPSRGLGWMPKRGCDPNTNEVARFYKLYAQKPLCEPIHMTCPRKSELFQDDLYPDTLSYEPTMSADEWQGGAKKTPKLMNMEQFFNSKTVAAGEKKKTVGLGGLGHLSQLNKAPANTASATPKAEPAKAEPKSEPRKVEPKSQPANTNNTSSSKPTKPVKPTTSEKDDGVQEAEKPKEEPVSASSTPPQISEAPPFAKKTPPQVKEISKPEEKTPPTGKETPPPVNKTPAPPKAESSSPKSDPKSSYQESLAYLEDLLRNLKSLRNTVTSHEGRIEHLEKLSNDQKKQIADLVAEIEQLKATVNSQGKRIEVLEDKLAAQNGN